MKTITSLFLIQKPHQIYSPFCNWNSKIYFGIIFLFISSILSAQQKKDSLKKTYPKLSVCDDLYLKNKIKKSIHCYQAATNTHPLFLNSYFKLAEVFYQRKDFTNSLFYINKAIDIDPNESFLPLCNMANQMNKNKDYDFALTIINRLSVSKIDAEKLKIVSENQLKYTLINQVKTDPIVGVNFENLGDSINSKENEYLPSLSLDDKTLVFTRNVGGNEDFFISHFDSIQNWRKAQNMGYPPNTGLPDGAAKLSADGYYLFYTRCDLRSPNGYEGGGCDIVFSYQEDTVWSDAQKLGATINTPGYEGQPCLSSDNKDLYFVSDREGGFGGKDIWVSHFANYLWSAPENLGPNINTSKDETAPFIHPDNVSFYFSSNGQIGLGDNDLFLSRRNNDGTWKKPINLGSPINTKGFDGSIVVNAKGTKGYCASNRSDSKGGLDLYSFDLYPAIKPIPTICLKGFVEDKLYGTKIWNAKINFTDTYNNTDIGLIKSNKGDASYTKALQVGKNYLISVDVNGYRPFYKLLNLNNDLLADNLFYSIKLRTPGLTDTLFKNQLVVDNSRNKFTIDSKLVLDTILSNWNDWNEDSAVVKIFLKGYYYAGDSLTDPSFKANLDQCVKQLKIATNYFENKGIKCEYLMTDLDMIAIKDDNEWFDKIEVIVVEDY